jgi:glycosyltransferase involved in cell wall biosynthesis
VKAPRFTIVTVSLNAGESLRETALSVLSQDCPDFEYLVQDGGSTDGSLAALPQDPRLRVIVEKDEGIYDAMNRAARRATGDYLNVLNAGDRFAEAGTLSSVAAILDASVPAPDLVYGDSIDERSAKVRRAPATFNRRALFLEGICHQAQWLRRETFLSLGGLDTTFRFRADHELLLSVAVRLCTSPGPSPFTTDGAFPRPAGIAPDSTRSGRPCGGRVTPSPSGSPGGGRPRRGCCG